MCVCVCVCVCEGMKVNSPGIIFTNWPLAHRIEHTRGWVGRGGRCRNKKDLVSSDDGLDVMQSPRAFYLHRFGKVLKTCIAKYFFP